jgi:hypothetical protein
MSKQARHSRRLAAHTQATTARATTAGAAGPDRRILAVLGGVGFLLVAGLAVAAITFAAVNGGSSGGLPSGTQTFPENDHTHVTGPVTYDRVPPAGGPHNPVQLNCGVYTEQVPNENAVHSLEHGAVWVTYQPNLPSAEVAQLQQLVTSNYVGSERYIILSPYLGLPSPIVASAWGAQLQLQQASDSRLLDFIHHFAGGGQGGEPGGPCTGGVGSPAA